MTGIGWMKKIWSEKQRDISYQIMVSKISVGCSANICDDASNTLTKIADPGMVEPLPVVVVINPNR